MASGTAVWATSPLTEIWTPASTCTLPLLQYEDGGNVNIWGTGGGTTTIQRVAQGCYPANYFVDDQKVLYSPGACPAGQTMANVQSLSNGATRASCCPRLVETFGCCLFGTDFIIVTHHSSLLRTSTTANRRSQAQAPLYLTMWLPQQALGSWSKRRL